MAEIDIISRMVELNVIFSFTTINQILLSCILGTYYPQGFQSTAY